METKWLIFILVVMFCMSFIFGIAEQRALTSSVSDGTDSVLYRLTHFDIGEASNPISLVTGFASAGFHWLRALLDAIFFNYKIFTGTLALFKYFMWVLGSAITIRLILAIRGS